MNRGASAPKTSRSHVQRHGQSIPCNTFNSLTICRSSSGT
jgi:hypothetical protein